MIDKTSDAFDGFVDAVRVIKRQERAADKADSLKTALSSFSARYFGHVDDGEILYTGLGEGEDLLRMPWQKTRDVIEDVGFGFGRYDGNGYGYTINREQSFVPGSGDRITTFFGESALGFVDRPDATLGPYRGSVWGMPLDDAAQLRARSDVVTQKGHAPSVTDAYLRGQRIYGISVPADKLRLRLPTIEDAGTNQHWRPGGFTGVEHNGVWKKNYTREFIAPGGDPVPEGSVLFEFPDSRAKCNFDELS